MFLRWKWIDETSINALLCFQGVCHLKCCSCSWEGETICKLFSSREERPMFPKRIPICLKASFGSRSCPICNLPLTTVPTDMQTPEQDGGAAVCSCLNPACRCSLGGVALERMASHWWSLVCSTFPCIGSGPEQEGEFHRSLTHSIVEIVTTLKFAKQLQIAPSPCRDLGWFVFNTLCLVLLRFYPSGKTIGSDVS